MTREELEKAGYVENGKIACPAHGGDHQAILFEHPKTGDSKTLCPKEGITV
ncbi:MAG: hypothetical protein RIC06_04120 [Cyclobacteriaceae bacterium]